MKNTGKQRKSDTVLFTLTIVLFAALVFLSASLIMLFNRSATEGNIPFDLDRLDSDGSAQNKAELANSLHPEFIGITAGDKRYGISISSAVMTDLYGELSAVISETVHYDNAEPADEGVWRSCAGASDSVYVRYHSELPDMIIGLFADIHTGRETKRDKVAAYVYEMFIMPSAEGDRTGFIAVRDMTGKVTAYRAGEGTSRLVNADLVKYLRSYTSSMREFVFAGNDYETTSVTEPVFAEALTTRNILTTNETAFLIRSSSGAVTRLMRVFGINPNKLFSTHESPSGTYSYTDRTGVLSIQKSAIEYRAAEANGMPVEDIIGYTDSVGIEEYISAVYKLMENIGAIEQHCAGGSADLCLMEISSSDGRVEMVFEYFIDNIPVIGPEPALTVSFEDGRLTYANLYTVTIKGISSRSETFVEWWFLDHLKQREHEIYNVSLVYRSDYIAESVSAEWRAAVK